MHFIEPLPDFDIQSMGLIVLVDSEDRSESLRIVTTSQLIVGCEFLNKVDEIFLTKYIPL